MSERCANCGKTGVDLVGLGGVGLGPVRKLCIDCVVVAMRGVRKARDRALRAMQKGR